MGHEARPAGISLAVLALLAGCGEPTEPHASYLEKEPVQVAPMINVRGPTSAQPWQEVHVKADGDSCGIWWSVFEGTPVVRLRDGSYEQVDLGALRLGSRLAVWSDGPLLMSCPAQGAADAIEVLE